MSGKGDIITAHFTLARSNAKLSRVSRSVCVFFLIFSIKFSARENALASPSKPDLMILKCGCFFFSASFFIIISGFFGLPTSAGWNAAYSAAGQAPFYHPGPAYMGAVAHGAGNFGPLQSPHLQGAHLSPSLPLMAAAMNSPYYAYPPSSPALAAAPYPFGASPLGMSPFSGMLPPPSQPMAYPHAPSPMSMPSAFLPCPPSYMPFAVANSHALFAVPTSSPRAPSTVPGMDGSARTKITDKKPLSGTHFAGYPPPESLSPASSSGATPDSALPPGTAIPTRALPSASARSRFVAVGLRRQGSSSTGTADPGTPASGEVALPNPDVAVAAMATMRARPGLPSPHAAVSFACEAETVTNGDARRVTVTFEPVLGKDKIYSPNRDDDYVDSEEADEEDRKSPDDEESYMPALETLPEWVYRTRRKGDPSEPKGRRRKSIYEKYALFALLACLLLAPEL